MYKLFISLLILLQVMLIKVCGDCGLPAIPPNVKISDFSSHYLEDTKIEYYCELPELELLGGKVRVCKNGQWIGSIPRCAEEIGYKSIQRIEITDSSGKIENNSNPIKSIGGKAFSADHSKGECIAGRGGSLKPVTFRVYLTKKYRHLSSFAIVLQTGREINNTKEIIEIFTNSLRTCIPTVTESAVAPLYLLRLNVICDLETTSDDETYYSYYNLDTTQNITLKFDSSSIAICELRLFYRKFNKFHQCGSPDFPLHSSFDFVRIGSKYGFMPYYRFTCEKNFELVGNTDVRCGINNYWLDQFPTCRPKIMCPMPPEVDSRSITVRMSYYELFVWNSTLVAIPGSKVTYDCEVTTNSSKFTIIGDSVRVCTDNGKWSGIEPYCVDINELKLEKYSEVVEGKVSKEIDLNINFNNDSSDCGLPGLPVFAKPTPGRIGSSGDFRSSYPNGTKIGYRCESAFHWMFSHFDTRICINGQWKGPIGQCDMNYGGKLTLKSIVISDYDSSKLIDEWIRPKRNISGNEKWVGLNSFSGWRFDECAQMNLTRKQKWSFLLNDTQPISGFLLTLRPGGIYGEYMTPKGGANITKKPLIAKVGRTFCEVGYVNDYPKLHTTINYRCDHDSTSEYSSHSVGVNEIVFYVDPKQFEPKFDVNNFTICSLTIYHSTDNCGIPDKPLHSIVEFKNQIAKYSCEDGYQLIGQDSVSCQRNGKWSEEFPTCKLKLNLCPKDKVNDNIGLGLISNYQNTVKGGSVVLGTIVKYQCLNISSFTGRSLLVGSRTRICLSNGEWSGSKPYCIDSSKYMTDYDSSQNSANHSLLFITIGIAVAIVSVIIALIVGLVLLYRRGVIDIPDILPKNQNSSSSATLPVRPDSRVDLSEINSTLEQLSCFESSPKLEIKSNNNTLKVDYNSTNKWQKEK